jgi:hypothetical protein
MKSKKVSPTGFSSIRAVIALLLFSSHQLPAVTALSQLSLALLLN